MFDDQKERAVSQQPPDASRGRTSLLSDTMFPAQAAAYLGVEANTLAIWRCTKRYPLPYIKVGRLVRYRKSDLDAFLASRTVEVSE
jgi:excisionase family DNA binding protein